MSNDSNIFHVDFMNGWEDGKLQEIIDNCPVEGDPEPGEYNPPCNCDQFLTLSPAIASEMCDDDVKSLILNEEIAVTKELPRGSCEGAPIWGKNWTVGDSPPLVCTPPPCTDCNEDEEDDEDEEEEECEDDPEFYYAEDEDLDCEWVAEEPEDRCDIQWEGYTLKSYCPEACDACDCRDGFELMFKDNPNKDCAWVRRRPGRRCEKEWDGETLLEFCPDACGECDD